MRSKLQIRADKNPYLRFIELLLPEVHDYSDKTQAVVVRPFPNQTKGVSCQCGLTGRSAERCSGESAWFEKNCYRNFTALETYNIHALQS